MSHHYRNRLFPSFKHTLVTIVKESHQTTFNFGLALEEAWSMPQTATTTTRKVSSASKTLKVPSTQRSLTSSIRKLQNRIQAVEQELQELRRWKATVTDTHRQCMNLRRNAVPKRLISSRPTSRHRIKSSQACVGTSSRHLGDQSQAKADANIIFASQPRGYPTVIYNAKPNTASSSAFVEGTIAEPVVPSYPSGNHIAFNQVPSNKSPTEIPQKILAEPEHGTTAVALDAESKGACAPNLGGGHMPATIKKAEKKVQGLQRIALRTGHNAIRDTSGHSFKETNVTMHTTGGARSILASVPAALNKLPAKNTKIGQILDGSRVENNRPLMCVASAKSGASKLSGPQEFQENGCSHGQIVSIKVSHDEERGRVRPPTMTPGQIGKLDAGVTARKIKLSVTEESVTKALADTPSAPDKRFAHLLLLTSNNLEASRPGSEQVQNVLRKEVSCQKLSYFSGGV